MSGVATAIVGSAVITSYIGSQAAKGAAQTQADAANRATDAQTAMYNNQVANQKPYLDAGTKALGEIQDNMATYNQPFTMSQFQADPGYQFTMNQGKQAIENSAAASGHMVSSQQLGNASTYAENMASNEFSNAYNRYNNNINNSYNRLASLAQLGQTGAQNVNAAGANAANNISSNVIGAGNASAAAQVGVANSINSGISSGVNGFMNYNLMNNLMPKGSANTLNQSVYGTTQSAQGLNGSSNFNMPEVGSNAGYSGSMASLLPGG